MGEPETVAVVTQNIAPQRMERRASQAPLRDEIDRCTERVRIAVEKLIGPRPRQAGNMDAKTVTRSIEQLKLAVGELEEGL